MSIRKFLLLFLAVILFSPGICLSSPSEITSITQLNNPRYRVGTDSQGPVLAMVMENLPDAQILKYDAFLSEYLALQSGKIDALTANESEFLSAVNNGLEHVRILPGYVGKPVPTAAGLSERSKIPGLKEKFNAFIAGLKADGTLSDMYKRWVHDNNTNMPVIDVPEKSDIHLTVATTGVVMPFSFYINSDVTGFDVELGRRFAAHIGATVEFKIYGFGSILMAIKSGAADIALSNLYVTPESAESVTFSDIIFSINCIAAVYDDAKTSANPNPPSDKADVSRKPKYSSLSELDGKTIGIQTGVVSWENTARKILPHSKIAFYNTFADLAAALKTRKIEAFLADEPVYNLMAAEDKNLAKIDEKITDSYSIAYGFPKTERGKKLCAEMSEYIRKLKAGGELDTIKAKWEGADESAKTLPDYKNFPAPNGTLHAATEGEYSPFNYYRGKEIAGLEIDIAARFCEAYGYGLKVTSMEWDAIIPAVVSGKYDFAAAALAPDDEHSGEIDFSEPYAYSRSVMACLKAEDSHVQTVRKTNERTPKYKHLSDLDGKNIGMQPGIIDWEEWAAENLPHSKIQYYNTYPDLVSALKTHKIEGFLVDSPVLDLMAAEDNTLAYIDEPVGKPFGYSFFAAQTEAGKKLCDEISEYIRKIKSNGELDAILSKWQGADESAKIPPDFKSLPAKKGTLTYAAEGSYPPFNYYKGTELAGIDIDIAVEFCRAYGYGLNVQTMFFDATIPAINSGKVDFAGDFTPSEEHEEAVYFSEPYCEARSVMACLKAEDSHVQTTDPLAGKRIGVQTGTTCAELVPEKIPSAKLAYYDSLTDELTALKAGKVDAVCCSIPAAIFAENEDARLTRINPPLRETYLYPIFAQTEKGRKLCDEYSAFLKTLWDNGTIDALNAKWLGHDDSKKITDDYSQLPSANGRIIMAVDTSLVPFAYVKNSRIVGYDIDLAVMFCKAKGYSLEVQNMPLTGAIASVKTGKSDFTQSLNKTPERAENTLFTSTPAIKSGNVLLTLKAGAALTVSTEVYTNLSQLNGKKIGVAVGSLNGELAKEKIPNAEIVYFNSNSDILPALIAGKIDAISCGHSTAVFMIREGHNVMYLPQQLGKTYRKAAFSRTERGRKLRREYSDFLKTLWDNGTINSLVQQWIDGEDDSRRVLDDYSNLPHPNGIITMAVDPSVTPYDYIKNGMILGYEIDIAVRFCKAKGYGLKIDAMSHNGVLGSLETGKCDFSYGIEYTDERDKSLFLSDTPNTESSNVIVVLKRSNHDLPSVNMKLSDFAGKKIGVITSTNGAIIVEKAVPSAKLVQYDSAPDMLIALKQGKIDALACGHPTAVFLMKANKGVAFVTEPLKENYRSAAFVPSDKGRKLCEEYGEFLQTLWDNGTINRLYDKWIINNDEYTKGEDYTQLPSTKGTLKMAADVAMMPFVYVKDNKIIGYDVDIAAMFCKAKGYGLEIVPMLHSGVLPALASGKCDFSYAMEYTEERAKSVLFSKVPNVQADNVLAVFNPSAKTPIPATVSNPENNAPEDNEPTFWEDVALSFRKTFIREDRWKLFAEGIMNTMFITVASIFCGMLLGFVAFMFCRTGSVIANIITKFSVWLIKGTPIVVLLMILYYVIFGHVNISGIIVAIIAFTLTFGTSVYRMLTFGTGAVDRGQTEAAYALGFTDMQTFFTVILPQAALHFMPSFKEEVTMLIKSTSVVGYIAVQDLTKMGDIVRSRTYEAFFPLIAVAAIYFVLAGMLNIIVNIIHTRITPSKRKPADILHGINTARRSENHD